MSISNNEAERSFDIVDDEEPVPPADIVSYNELRSCADLVRLHETGKLEIQPDFQRDVVWKLDEQTRFIDSLVKQLPIPSMCFSLDYKSQKWKVIDGLQRMSSIINFLTNENWKLSNLPDIHPRLRNSTPSQIRNSDETGQRLFSIVQDVSIPVTVIRCDYSQSDHMRYLFTIFHRLNSGGVRLNNQEIRNCIYNGPFNDRLKWFDQHNSGWSRVRRRIYGKTDRFRSAEILLRTMAFGDWLDDYDGNLARFLNEYMFSRTKTDDHALGATFDRLSIVAAAASEILAADASKFKLPLSLIESVLVGLYVNSEKITPARVGELTQKYFELKSQATFSEGVRYAITSAENVKRRLSEAISAFR
ncbi:MAG: DUF262 domain-containing protein [Methylobacteriaceae bacterium]|nr:DUF262 domain-containing protein [Methylobacteriaceae bacterium]